MLQGGYVSEAREPGFPCPSRGLTLPTQWLNLRNPRNAPSLAVWLDSLRTCQAACPALARALQGLDGQCQSAFPDCCESDVRIRQEQAGASRSKQERDLRQLESLLQVVARLGNLHLQMGMVGFHGLFNVAHCLFCFQFRCSKCSNRHSDLEVSCKHQSNNSPSPKIDSPPDPRDDDKEGHVITNLLLLLLQQLLHHNLLFLLLLLLLPVLLLLLLVSLVLVFLLSLILLLILNSYLQRVREADAFQIWLQFLNLWQQRSL